MTAAPSGGAPPARPGAFVQGDVPAEIIALIVAADECASLRDAAAYAALFVEDGRMTGSQGSATGRTELRDRVSAVWAGEVVGSVHLTLNPVVGPAVHDRANATSRLLVVDPATATVVAVAAVQHELQHVDGRWRFSLRHVA